MTGTSTVERVSFEIITARSKAPVCRITVESPDVAKIDMDHPGCEDALDTLAQEIDPETYRLARAKLAETMNSNPLMGWGTFSFTGHA